MPKLSDVSELKPAEVYEVRHPVFGYFQIYVASIQKNVIRCWICDKTVRVTDIVFWKKGSPIMLVWRDSIFFTVTEKEASKCLARLSTLRKWKKPSQAE